MSICNFSCAISVELDRKPGFISSKKLLPHIDIFARGKFGEVSGNYRWDGAAAHWDHC